MLAFIEETLAQNAPGFVLTALVVCAVMAATVVILLRRAERLEGAERALWAALLAAVAGVGVWTTHFVAILGYRPDALLSYDAGVTLISALVGVALVGGPLAASAFVHRRPGKAALGALAGLGVGAMHFAGMGALEGCVVGYDGRTNLVALALSAGAFAAALALGRGRRRGVAAAALIVLGVCALHFTAMYGVTLERLAGGAAPGINATALSALVAFASLGLSGAAVTALVTESRLDSERRAAAEAQARQDAVFSVALHNMSNGLVMVDAHGRVSAFNQRALELLRLEPDDIAPGLDLAVVLATIGRRSGWSVEEVEDFTAEHAAWLRAGGATRVERRFADSRTLSIACRPMPAGGAIVTYDDVTEHRVAQQAMAHMAYHDALTGLPNRRSFREEMQRVLAGAGAAAVLMLDLDRFKWVNDTLGHPVGDALLVQVALRLRDACRAEDKVFRLGGDELAVLTLHGSAATARALAERLIAAFATPFAVDGHTVGIGCSIGFACSDDEAERRHLVEKADLALYRAKALGRNRAEGYASGMMERAIERRQMELDLADALRDGAFDLHYQPLCDLPSRRLVGFEALIRWRRGDRGMVPPSEFIPIAEANGMILSIGAWVLDAACRQLARWPERLHVAVNVSAVQMRAPDIVRLVADALARHGVAASRLELELTETAMVEDGRAMSETLKALRRLGVRIAMDDFGTGYSSLAHLRDFELDRIKIDRSFVDAGGDDVGARAVIRAVTSLARDLSILTIGEGVETDEQLGRLVELGCDAAQGFLLGRPVDALAAGRMIAVQQFEDDAAAERREADAARAAPVRRPRTGRAG